MEKNDKKILRFTSERKLKFFPPSGRMTIGELYGYDYDFDDDGNEFLEFDVENENGLLIGFTEDEIERIDIIG